MFAFNGTGRLAIFVAGFVAVAGIPPASAQLGPCGERVLVRAGDTLSAIARRCGTNVVAIQNMNPRLRIDPNALYVGMAIALPAFAAAPLPDPDIVVRPVVPAAPRPLPEIAVQDYVVRPGDTLASIALDYRTSLPEIILLNPGINPLFLRVGQIIRLPGGIVVDPAPEPGRDIAATISPDRGPVGTIVEVEASGFPPDTRLRLTAGTSGRDQREIERVRTNRRGRAVVNVRIPDWAAGERRMVFRFETLDGRLRTENDRFRIVEEEPDRDQMRVTGTLTREGVECQALRGDDGRLYTLAGEFAGFRPGDRVSVRGRVADRSTCMQGITIDVRRIDDAG